MGQVFAFLPLLLRHLGVTATATGFWLGILSALPFLIGLPLVPFWGAWAEKYSHKRIIARSAYVEALVFFILAYASSLPLLVLGMSLVGFQLGNTGIIMSVLRSRIPQKRLGSLLSLFGVAAAFGMAAGPALGGYWLSDGFSFKLLFLVDAILSLVSGLMLTFWLADPSRNSGRDLGAWKLAVTSVRSLVASPVVLFLYGIFTAFMMARQVASPYLPLFVTALYAHSNHLASYIGLVVGGGALVGVVLTPFAGFLGDHFGFLSVLRIAQGGYVMGLLVILFAKSLPFLFVGSLLLGLSGSTISSMIFSLLAIMVPENERTAALNLAYVPLYLGGITGPTLAAFLATLNMRWVYWLAVLLVGIGFWLATVMIKKTEMMMEHRH